MKTIEDYIVKELQENYENAVKELIKKVYHTVSGNRELLFTHLGNELHFFMADNYDGYSLQERLVRIGLAYVDWDEIAEQILDFYKEVI
jgi:DNA-binding ferritin-like protein (Dps family)